MSDTLSRKRLGDFKKKKKTHVPRQGKPGSSKTQSWITIEIKKNKKGV